MERFANTSMGFFYERDKGAVSFYFRVFIEAISNMYKVYLWKHLKLSGEVYGP